MSAPDDFYDGPRFVWLLGGPHNGQRVEIDHQGLHDVLRVPVPPTLTIGMEVDPDPLILTGHPTYRYTNSFNRGERIYRYIGDH